MMKKSLWAVLVAVALCIVFFAFGIFYVLSTLPDISRLKHYRPPCASEVFDRTGRILTQYYDRTLRFWVPVSEVPDLVIRSVVIAEDDTFFEHSGVNYKATWDALVYDVEKRRFSRGGSTITQQMIKNVFFSRKKTLIRKVREYFMARRAEYILTKRQIIEIYLNEVEWGENLHGIEAASRYYFDKHVQELTAAESALLAGMLPNPKYYNPFKRPEKAKERQTRVLSNMLQAKVITEDVYANAIASPMRLRSDASARFDLSALSGTGARPCYQRLVEEVLLPIYGEDGLFREGRKITTSLDKDIQERILAQEGAGVSEVPERITVVTKGGEVRALSCSSQETIIRSWFDSLGMPVSEYSVETVLTRSLKASDLIPAALAGSP